MKSALEIIPSRKVFPLITKVLGGIVMFGGDLF